MAGTDRERKRERSTGTASPWPWLTQDEAACRSEQKRREKCLLTSGGAFATGRAAAAAVAKIRSPAAPPAAGEATEGGEW